MESAAQLEPVSEKNAVEVVVYIKGRLNKDQRDLVISALNKTDGILDAEFCELREHLMLTRYNKEVFNSSDVLKSLESLRLEARLIGPI